LPTDTNEATAQTAMTALRRFRVPIRARTGVVIVSIALLGTVAGLVVLSQITDQMRGEADARQDRHVVDESASLEALMASASRDLRLARRNTVFDAALADTSGQLLPADRAAVETAISYLGDRYQVDEICLIRSDGLEAARWVGGAGVAPLSDLSPDERQNNPAVLPTLPLADDAFYETAPYVSPDSNRWVLGLATPIILASGVHAGVLHMEIPIERFATELDGMAFGPNSYSVLLDRSGKLLVHPELDVFRTQQGIPANPDTAEFPIAAAAGSTSWRDAVSTMLSNPSGATTFQEDGATYRLTYQAVPGSSRIVGVVTPTSELYADVNRVLLNLAVTAGPLLILVIGVGAWFGQRASKSNRRLAQVNARLEGVNEALEQTSRSSSELARESALLNQFTELSALSEDEVALSSATIATLDELLHPDDAALHVSNPSKDRAVPQATQGDQAADVLSLRELGRCPALRRSSLYVTADVSARLAYGCPVYPVESGTLACIPLVALGETVGAAHLHWREPRDLSLPLRLAITRVAEHAALSIANRRLLLALRGQADTDARTGLTNSRAFDETVARILSLRAQRDPLSVLMLDLDHFKEFNDRYGHPAGDEALRAFANLMTSCIRDDDLAARYGGEEFAIALPGTDAAAALEVAERIRERTEATIIPLAPGVTGRLTVSIGISSAPADGTELLSLLRAADEALYRAKLDGRNRVVTRQPPKAGGVRRVPRTTTA
jgi:diguanylate cyclase (GGDEF)-like protein